MSEEEAKLALQGIVENNAEVAMHLQRIRMLTKGYWSTKAAKEYIDNLSLEV